MYNRNHIENVCPLAVFLEREPLQIAVRKKLGNDVWHDSESIATNQSIANEQECLKTM